MPAVQSENTFWAIGRSYGIVEDPTGEKMRYPHLAPRIATMRDQDTIQPVPPAFRNPSPFPV